MPIWYFFIAEMAKVTLLRLTVLPRPPVTVGKLPRDLDQVPKMTFKARAPCFVLR